MSIYGSSKLKKRDNGPKGQDMTGKYDHEIKKKKMKPWSKKKISFFPSK